MRRFFVIIQAMALSSVLLAQNTNLNPTVQVTNAYENNVKDFERQALKAEIPDSLYEFDLNFDYSGFEKPYKGNDEFNPFLTELDLVARPYDGKNFYLKAGAGYTLHPQLDLSWAIPSKGRFKSGLFLNHRSYFGKYLIDLPGRGDLQGASSNGTDSYSKAGFEGRADWERLRLQTAVWYDGVWSTNAALGESGRNYNSGSAMLRIASRDLGASHTFKYDIRLNDSFGSSKLAFETLSARLNENVLDGSVLLGYQTGVSFFGLGSDLNVASGSISVDNATESYGGFALALRPQYRYGGETVTLEAGLAMLVSGTDGTMTNSSTADGKDEKFNIWPFVKFEWRAAADRFIIFADADVRGVAAGERRAWKASHLSLAYNPSLVKTSFADLGIKGTVARKVQWKLGAGYENVRNANVFGLVHPGAVSALIGAVSAPIPELAVLPKLDNFNFFLNVDATFGIFSLDADVRYRAFLGKDKLDVLPSAFTADIRAAFDILSRASVYAGGDFRSSRKAGCDYTAPAYIDIYAGVDFRLNRKLGLFLEGRNLLGRQLQIVPGISEKGVSITGGIVLNF